MDQIAVITGAGSGIGRALAHELASRDIDVLGIGRRREPLVETSDHNPERIRHVVADVSLADGRRTIVDAIGEANVRFLVHNAALLEPIKHLEDVAEHEWRYHMDVNVDAPLFLTQSLLPRMTKGGRILHVSTGAAHKPYEGWGAYCTSKAALFMMYRVWKEELADRDIHIGSVAPGIVDTDMQAQIRSASKKDFPGKERFVKLKETNQLWSPETPARFFAWLLLETESDEFSADEWDARDESHHHRWKTG